jgi:uncharacterized protein YbdZ (MbtH family)
VGHLGDQVEEPADAGHPQASWPAAEDRFIDELMEIDMTNPFEDDERSYLVLTNDENQHSLWPTNVDVPGGWSVAFGPVNRSECLEYVKEHWVDMRPKSLIDERSDTT